MSATRYYALVSYRWCRTGGVKAAMSLSSWLRCSGNTLVSINEVNLHRAQSVLGWVTVSGFDSRRRHFISVCNPPPRSTQPSTLRGTVKWVPAKEQWWSAAESKRQAWCNLQVKLCDPRLSSLEVVTTMCYTYRRILYFTLLSCRSRKAGIQ